MSSTVTVRPAKGTRGIGMLSIIVGILLIVAGIVVWIIVSMTLSDEQITVSDDATPSMFAGQHVAGPFTAYAQAEVIDKHALEASGGLTYAELDQDDPARATVMNASFLRASLFTSVVAFGVCALVIGLGLMFILIGMALRKLAGGPSVAVETPTYSSGGDLSQAASTAPARQSAGAHTAEQPPATPPASATPPERRSSRSEATAPSTPAAPSYAASSSPAASSPSATGAGDATSSPAQKPDDTDTTRP